jgi:mannuronan synthase
MLANGPINGFLRRSILLRNWDKAWKGVHPVLKIFVIFLLLSFAFRFVYLYNQEVYERLSKRGLLITIGVVGGLRVLWSTINAYRAFLFRLVKLPRLRRDAAALPFARQYPADIYFIIPSVREELCITRRQVKSIFREAQKIPSRVTVIYAMADESEFEIIRSIARHDPRRDSVRFLFTLQNSKRNGMANALRVAIEEHKGGSSLVVLMDGDTVMGPDLMPRTLPLFAVRPRLGGLTTVNFAMAKGGGPWFRDFYNFRFASRSHYMSAVSFANCVFTLTGRFSIVRGEIGLNENFINAIENDYIDDFIHGRIKLITGDDKSTWFYLKKQGWDMICLPDAYAYAMENAGPTPLKTTIRKLHRWMGNMLRFNRRGLALGPKRIGGLWIWLTLLDQRVCMWTSLVGLLTALTLSLMFTPFIFFIYLAMLVLRRLLYLWMLVVEGNRLTMRYLPILLFCQWASSIVKIWILSDISKQAWTADRAGQTSSAARERMSLISPRLTGRLYITAVTMIFVYAVIQLAPH